jgi:hypothetical protein
LASSLSNRFFSLGTGFALFFHFGVVQPKSEAMACSGEDCSSIYKCADVAGEPAGDGYDAQGNGPFCCGAMTLTSGNKKK